MIERKILSLCPSAFNLFMRFNLWMCTLSSKIHPNPLTFKKSAQLFLTGVNEKKSNQPDNWNANDYEKHNKEWAMITKDDCDSIDSTIYMNLEHEMALRLWNKSLFSSKISHTTWDGEGKLETHSYGERKIDICFNFSFLEAFLRQKRKSNVFYVYRLCLHRSKTFSNFFSFFFVHVQIQK